MISLIDESDNSNRRRTLLGDDTSVTDCLVDTLAELAAQTELLNQLAVAVLVFRLQVVKQLTTLVDHLQQTLTAMVIFLVLTEMLGKFCNSLRQQCNLNLRGACIGFTTCMFGNNALLCFTGK